MKTLIVRVAVLGALLSPLAASAQWESYRPRQSMSIFNYEMSAPIGSFKDNYIKNTSWRGFSFENRSMINERFSAGFAFGYNRYEQTYDLLTLDRPNGGVISGPVYRYTDQLAVKALVHAYFLDGPLRPYVGVGLGGVWSYAYAQSADFAQVNDGFHFIASPELGLTFTAARGASSLGLNLAFRYNYTTASYAQVTDASNVAVVVGLFGAY